MITEMIEAFTAVLARVGRDGIPKDRFVFLQEFLKNPQEVASIIPSSRYLERRVVKLGEITSAKTVVELGSGTGGTTRAILQAMHPDARLLGIEINPGFYQSITQISDNRLIAHLGSAHELQSILAEYHLNSPDVIISGIPFSLIDESLGTQIIREISSVLPDGGRFLAYQIRDRVAELALPLLGEANVEVEFLNIPPVRVFCWEK